MWLINAVQAVFGRDVAETTPWALGDGAGLLRRCGAPDDGDGAVYETLVQSAAGGAPDTARADDFAGDADVAVLGHRPEQGVHIDRDLDVVGALFLAGLDVLD